MAEGCFARAAYAADIVLYDGEPSALLPWQKRRHRWLRGDMQLLPFLFPPLNSGIDAVSRRKILFAAAFLFAAVLGLRPLFLLAVTTFFIDLLLEAAFLLLRLPFRKSALRPLVLLAGRRLYELAVLPYSALRDADAVSRHCFRAPHSEQLFSPPPFLRQLQRHGRYTTAKPQAWQRRVLRRRCFGFVRR